MKPIRIAYIIDNLDRGGAQTCLHNLVAGLSKLGYEQRIYCLNEKYSPKIVASLINAGAYVDIIGRPKLYLLVGLFHLYRELRRIKPDIVLTTLPYGDIIGRSIAKFAGMPLILSSIQNRHMEKSSFHFLFDQITARWVKKIIFVAKENIPFAIEHEGVRPDQAVYIPNGIPIEKYSAGENTKSLRVAFGASNENIVLGMVARLSPQKGHENLLKAFAIAQKQRPETMLWIVGDGPLRKKLVKLAENLGIANNIRFWGDRDDIPEILKALDIFIHTSFHEGMPTAVMEAMAGGKPIIVSNVDGVASLIDDGETGWFVESLSPEDIAQKIFFVLENKNLWGKIGLAARERIEKEFSVKKMIAAYDSFYQSCLYSVRLII